MDFDKYLIQYSNVSRDELLKFRELLPSDQFVKTEVKHLHDKRENEKKHGRAALRTRPLVQLVSVTLQPNNDEPISVYGRIHADFYDSRGASVVQEIYNRNRDVPEITNTLTLNGPHASCWPHHACLPLHGSRISVSLFDGANHSVFARKSFCLDDSLIEDGHEHVKSMLIQGEKGSLLVNYIAIPFGVTSRVQITVHNRNDSRKRDFIDVFGKVAVRYADTYGDYSSEESILFEKQDNDFERVEIDYDNPMLLSRSWVALPAYSSIVVDVDLSEYGTKQSIVKGTTQQFLPEQSYGETDTFVFDDFFIRVFVSWLSPCPPRRDYHSPPSLRGIPTEQIEEMDTEGEIPTEDMDTEGEDESSSSSSSDESDNMDTEGEDESSSSSDESDKALSSQPKSSWILRPHKSKPLPSSAVEIFSVFIGREKSKAVQVFGSIAVLSDECFYIFKRDENDALGLLEHMRSVPILDGSRIFEGSTSLEMKFDIKDVEGELAIKGYVDWDAGVLDSNSFHEKQLCSFIQGQHGFAAVHYSIFSEAVAANIKVFLNLKMKYGDVYPKICGTLTACYSGYDYSSQYNKDYYQILLFRRTQDDSIQLSTDWAIPLSRSMVVVPSYSSLLFDIYLSFGVSDQKCVEEIEIEIGTSRKNIETDEFSLRIELDWCEIK